MGRAATTREPGAQPAFSLPPRCRLVLLLGLLLAAGSLPCVTRTALAANSLNPPRFDADVVLYNAVSCGPSLGWRASAFSLSNLPMQAADKIMAAANKQGAKIATADLYSFVLGKCGGAGYKTCDGFQLPMNVHYTGER